MVSSSVQIVPTTNDDKDVCAYRQTKVRSLHSV